jgi:hypothetical protein
LILRPGLHRSFTAGNCIIFSDEAKEELDPICTAVIVL